MLKLRIFHYFLKGVIACRGDAIKVKGIAASLVEEINERNTERNNPNDSFGISNLLINDQAQMHA